MGHARQHLKSSVVEKKSSTNAEAALLPTAHVKGTPRSWLYR